MKTFKEFIEESLASEKIHVNPSIEQIKSLVKNSKEGRLRFVHHKDGSLLVGDAYHHTHSSVCSDHKGWKHWGNFFHRKEKLSYNVDNVRADSSYKSHPLYQKLEANGFRDGSY